MGKFSRSNLFEPFGPGTTNHPSATNSNQEYNTDVIGQFTQVISNRALNEFRAGYASYGITQASLTTWSNHWQAANGITTDGPSITFRGFSFNRNNNLPRYRNQDVYTVHDDFTLSYDAIGRHDLKLGGEYLHFLDDTRNCNRCGGVITANGGPVPANIQALFPDAFNADTWRLGAGRLEDRIEAHPEPGAQIRPDLERLRAGRELPAVRDARTSAGCGQPPTARGVRLPAHRPHRPARRHRQVLQRHPQHERALADESADDRGHCRRQQLHAARLRGEPVQRTAPDVRPGAAAVLLRQQRPGLPAARPSGTGADSSVLACTAQLAEFNRGCTSDRQ